MTTSGLQNEEKAHVYQFETLQVHAGQQPDSSSHARAPPIYATTSFTLGTLERTARVMASEEENGYVYTRLSNPTHETAEKRLAALEKGAAACLVPSGQAAVFTTLLSLCREGDNVVAHIRVYSGMYDTLKQTMRRLGIQIRFVADTLPGTYQKAIDDRTRGLLVESMDWQGNVTDMEALAKVAHGAGVPLVVENSMGAGGYLIKPIEHGADIVIHSATNYIIGHGTAVAGAVIDAGKFKDWTNGKYPDIVGENNDGFYHTSFGPLAFLMRLRLDIVVETGICSDPFSAFLILQGAETLSLRMEKHCANALALAQWLDGRQEVEWVSYPGLKSHTAHAMAKRYLQNGFGGVLSFALRVGSPKAFIKNLKLAAESTDIGNVRTVVSVPIESSGRIITEQDKPFLGGVTKETIRVSVGTEYIDDILADFEQALRITGST
ncbi:Cys/Met metabolism PLP-dependent enzyme-domain-containing protein [Dichotomocladium elegans]|nr:Cys/Met metabolism PLP-dependent enzyme-domain-containing protein [Dichotomocladium elegans]